MYDDPDGEWISLSLLIGVIVGALFGLGSSVIEDYKDNQSIDGSIGWQTYFGNTLGGAISGLGQGFAGTVIMGIAGSVTVSLISNGGDFNGDVVLDAIKSGVFSAIGYGIGDFMRYTSAILDAKGFKLLSKNIGNNKTNKILNFLDVNVKIGTKNINKLANSIYSANAGIISDFIGDFSSKIITSLLEKL